MSNPLESLHFEVILDHSKFDAEVEKVRTAAKQFNTDISKMLDLRKQMNKEALESAKNEEQITRQRQKTEQMYQRELERTRRERLKTEEQLRREAEKTATQAEKTATQAAKTAAAQEKAKAATAGLNTQLHTTMNLASTIAQLTGVYLGVAGVRRFVSSLVEVSGQFEVQKMALTSMLQSADRADELFTRLRQNALESPYTFQDLTMFAKQLTAFNIPYEKLVDTEKMLADVAAAVGVDMGRIILAYGQVKAAGALKGQELRQFTEAGVPILEELAKQIEETEGKAVSLSEVFSRISKKQIPFEMVEEAFRRMTSEGGKFYNMQEVLVQTLQGRIGKLRDVWQQALYDLGQANDGVLKGTVDALTNLAGHLEEIIKVLTPVIAAFGAYYAALMLAAVAEKAVAGALVIGNLARLATGAANASAMLAKLGVSAKAAALGLAAFVAVVGVQLYKELTSTEEEFEEFKKHLDEIHDAARSSSDYAEVDRLKNLKAIAEDVNRTYDERKGAIDALNATVPAYHAALDTEGKLIHANNKELDDYIAKLEQAARQRSIEEELTQLYKEQRAAAEKVSAAQEKVDNANPLAPNSTQATALGKKGGNLALMAIGGLFLNDQDRKALEEAQREKAEIDRRIRNLLSEGAATVTNTMGWGNDWEGNSIFGKGKSDAEKELETLINLLRKFKDAYDKLLPYVGEDSIGSVLASIFDPTGANGYSFVDLEGQLSKALDDLAALGGDAADNAEKIRASLGLDEVSKLVKGYKDAETALKKYQTIREKFDKDWGNGGAAKIAADYRNEEVAINKEYAEGLKAIAVAYKDDAEAAERERESLSRLRDERQAANRESAQSKITELASKFVKEKTGSMNLRDWGDKSIGQTRALAEELRLLADGVIALDTTTVLALGEVGYSVNAFMELLKKGFETAAEESEEELDKKMGRTLKAVAGILNNTIDSMVELAEVAGRDDFAKGISAVGDVVGTLGNMAKYVKDEDFLGAAVTGVSFVVSKIFEAITATARWNAKLAELREEARRMGISQMLSTDGIFGANGMLSLTRGRDVMAYTRADMDWMTRNIEYFNPQSMLTQSLADIMKDRGLDMYDKNGILNRESLEALIELYPRLRNELTQLINDVDLYYDAVERVESITSEIIGNVVDDAADAMIEQWLAAGDAAIDYANILDDVAKAYGRMVVKSMIMDNLDKNLTSELTSLITEGRADEAMAKLSDALAGLEAIIPNINDFLAQLGLTTSGNNAQGNSVGAGIKAITEETASLLASYINAMRADVSVMRGLQERGWDNVDVIARSMPTLNDYIAQIAASTYDAARNTDQILSVLNEVIGFEGSSGRIVRVQIS